MPIFLRINMSKQDAILVKEHLTNFFEVLNQKKASVQDKTFQELGFTIEEFNLGKINSDRAIKKILNLLKNIVGEEACLNV